MTEKLLDCAICEHHYHVSRDHCPTCGAKRVFLATHSYEPQRTCVTYRDVGRMSCELVRAFRSNIAFQMITR